MANLLYSHFPENALGGSASGDAAIDFLSDTIKLALLTSTYTPAQTSHEWFSDITNEVSGTGYTAGGATLASKTVSTSGTTVTVDAADPAWSSSTITARYGVLYKSTGTAATSPLIGLYDFGSDYISTNGTFTFTVNASGLLTITV